MSKVENTVVRALADKDRTKPFKPFLVESLGPYSNIYRVIDLDEQPREHIEQLLEKLPIYFRVFRDSDSSGEKVSEPVLVRVSGAIIYIYPQRHRIISCTTVSSWQFADVVSGFKFDNLMDTESPGEGQVRCCVHFNPSILGVPYWVGHGEEIDTEIEVDIYMLPIDRTPSLKPPSVDVAELLDLIEGKGPGEGVLTAEKVRKWRDLIRYAVEKMRLCYENADTPEDYPVRVYYKECWQRIHDAGKDDKKLAHALSYLRESIRHK